MHSYNIKNPNLSVELIHEIVNFLPFDIKWKDFRVSLIFDNLLLKNQRNFIIFSKRVKKILNGLTFKRTQFEQFSRTLGDLSLDNLNLINEKANLLFHYCKIIGVVLVKYNLPFSFRFDSVAWPTSYFLNVNRENMIQCVSCKMKILENLCELSVNMVQANFPTVQNDIGHIAGNIMILNHFTDEITSIIEVSIKIVLKKMAQHKMESLLLLGSNNNNVIFEEEWAKSLPVNVSKFEWQDLFSTNNRITSWVDSGNEKLLSVLKEELTKHVGEAANKILPHSDVDSLLKAYIQEWEGYSILCRYLPLPFCFVETREKESKRGRSKQGMQVRELMLDRWNKYVFSKISTRLLNAAMSLIDRERNGELVNSQHIIGVQESFVDLSIVGNLNYAEQFEEQYITFTEQFYSSRTSQILAENGVLAYMAYVDEKLVEEEERAKRYLDGETDGKSKGKLMEKCVQVLIINYQDQILAEAPGLIKSGQIDRLQILYRLINRTLDGIPTLLDALRSHICEEGLAAMKAHAAEICTDSERYVHQLLEQYTRFSTLMRDAFANDARFLTIRDQAFREVVNNTDVFRLELGGNGGGKRTGKPQNTESKCPELLANYCDLLLRKSALTKRYTCDEIDERLNNVLLVLKYVQAKDVFMRYHKTHLSRRLILELVADQEKEEMLVNKFREVGMPVDFVNKLFRMLQDIEVNKDLNAAFKQSVSLNENCSEMADCVNIKILNAGAWSRNRETIHLTLPRELEDLLPEVDEFYKKQHCGRKLNWAHHWSTGTLFLQMKLENLNWK
uniref:Cullin-5 n=1 Tax=Meloidogyne incognita TaxID=6306 RepID=A0A914MG67_MELIC